MKAVPHIIFIAIKGVEHARFTIFGGFFIEYLFLVFGLLMIILLRLGV